MTYVASAVMQFRQELSFPMIVSQMGYTSTRAQLMSVPPYACAAVLTIAVGYAADKVANEDYAIFSCL